MKKRASLGLLLEIYLELLILLFPKLTKKMQICVIVLHNKRKTLETFIRKPIENPKSKPYPMACHTPASEITSKIEAISKPCPNASKYLLGKRSVAIPPIIIPANEAGPMMLKAEADTVELNPLTAKISTWWKIKAVPIKELGTLATSKSQNE